MTLSFFNQRSECAHQHHMRIEVAGMSREVCQSCGKVSVGFVQSHLTTSRVQAFREAAASTDTGSDD